MKRIALLSTVLLMAYMGTAQQAFTDCSNAYIVCSNDPISIKYIPIVNGLSGISDAGCIKGIFPTSNSMWFKWETKSDGNLGFSLLPINEKDDLDFVLYKMTDGLSNCGQKEVIRCMASGENRGDMKNAAGQACSGITGLADTSSDVAETSGCATSDDNFLAEIQTQEGDVYALLVNNYYSSNGFILEFTGTASFAPIAGHCPNDDSETSEPVQLNGIHDKGLYFDPVYPNPSRSEISLPIISEKKYDNGRLQIVSLHGDVVDVNALSIKPGINDVNIKIGHLPVGIYFIKIVLGENTHITRFSKF